MPGPPRLKPPPYSGRRLDAFEDSPNEKEVQGPSGKIYAGASFFCVLPGHWPRKYFILVCEHRFFDPMILLTILANCSTMAWESPLDPEGTAKAAYAAAPPTHSGHAHPGSSLAISFLAASARTRRTRPAVRATALAGSSRCASGSF